MKKKARILTALVLIMIMTFGMNLEASALTGKTHVAELKRLALLNNATTDGTNIYCSSINAMGISRDGDTNCLYTIKVNNTNEEEAIMYYFPDIAEWDEYIKFEISGVGHANGMTVDKEYIYICANSKVSSEKPNNKIVRVDRDYISSLSNTNNPQLVASSSNENCKILQPQMINPKESERATKPYVDYTGTFSTITMYDSPGTFIIGKKIVGDEDELFYNGFTKAEIIGDKFVVSTNTDDMFLVKNNIQYKYAAKQDICYVDGYGLFIGRWYGKDDDNNENTTNPLTNPKKNVILWADIKENTPDTYTTSDNVTYRCFTPDKIKIDVDGYISSEYGVEMYTFFEIESLGITKKGNLVANFNINYTTDYRTAFNAANGVNPSRGGIYKITRDGGKQFTLS